MKLAGAVCVLAGAVWGWRCQALERRRKRDTLADLIRLLGRMGEEIRLRRTSLPWLLHQLAADRGPACRSFCEAAAGAMDRGEPLESGWRLAAEALPLAAEDRSALLALGESLQGDEEQICKAIELARGLLAESLEETRSRRAETERRAAALWLSAGALVVITLI